MGLKAHKHHLLEPSERSVGTVGLTTLALAGQSGEFIER